MDFPPTSGTSARRAAPARGVRRGLAGPAGKDGLTFALHGGDEYELLFTARPNHRIPKQIAGVPVTRIGEITGGKQMKLAVGDGKTEILRPGGWEHFGP